jgi:hypothetical protein
VHTVLGPAIDDMEILIHRSKTISTRPIRSKPLRGVAPACLRPGAGQALLAYSVTLVVQITRNDE